MVCGSIYKNHQNRKIEQEPDNSSAVFLLKNVDLSFFVHFLIVLQVPVIFLNKYINNFLL